MIHSHRHLFRFDVPAVSFIPPTMKLSFTALAIVSTFAAVAVSSSSPPPQGDDNSAETSSTGVNWHLRGKQNTETPHRLLPGKQTEGLSEDAFDELNASGLFDYLGVFTPLASVPIPDGDGWFQHSYNPLFNNSNPQNPQFDGPVCITGAPYSVFSRPGNSDKLLIFLSGGGACWQNQYQCTPQITDDQVPPYPERGIADFVNDDNPFQDYNIVVLPYCDGSVFIGDNDVFDLDFAEFILEQSNVTIAPKRFHYGVRNLSAGMDLAKSLFGAASQVVVAGTSAGGVGAQVHAPFFARYLFGNSVPLFVLNDVGPIMTNLEDTVGVAARANDWDFAKFLPASLDVDPVEDQIGIEILLYRLENDATVKDAFYETDGDATNRFGYMNFIPGVDFRSEHRDIVVDSHGVVHCAFPYRYKRFILSDDASHTSLVVTPQNAPLPDPFYTKTANVGKKSVVLNDWVGGFLSHDGKIWVDVVEKYVDIYPNAELQVLGFGQVCTKCWCVPEDGPDGHCPDLGNRKYYGPDVIAKFASLTLDGSAPTFNPKICQPFPELREPPFSFLPGLPSTPCEEPVGLGRHAVCAFLYDTETCSERTNYELKTYKNAYEADKAGAIITHEGDCGVCSRAQDMAANMNPQLGAKSAECGLAFGASQNVTALIECFGGLGFSPDCATLFAYNAINTAGPGNCTQICLNPFVLPNELETCNLNACLQCDEDASSEIFALYAGRNRRLSGILAPTLRECKTVANIGQDPCATENPSISKKSSKKGSKKSKKCQMFYSH